MWGLGDIIFISSLLQMLLHILWVTSNHHTACHYRSLHWYIFLPAQLCTPALQKQRETTWIQCISVMRHQYWLYTKNKQRVFVYRHWPSGSSSRVRAHLLGGLSTSATWTGGSANFFCVSQYFLTSSSRDAHVQTTHTNYRRCYEK